MLRHIRLFSYSNFHSPCHLLNLYVHKSMHEYIYIYIYICIYTLFIFICSSKGDVPTLRFQGKVLQQQFSFKPKQSRKAVTVTTLMPGRQSWNISSFMLQDTQFRTLAFASFGGTMELKTCS
uniref:Uncharacterized protein n=1 Tax=Physcomitrium patens TaxID=3218 RepID=A0A2K1JQ60_PHYPA|nr:hypothetical protein PHYPA_016060 [Physcomitrium patens]